MDAPALGYRERPFDPLAHGFAVADRSAWHAAVLALVWGAAFPRLARRVRWPTRLGPRGLLAYVLARWAIIWVLGETVMPLIRRIPGVVPRAVEELRTELGREPTHAELSERITSLLDRPA